MTEKKIRLLIVEDEAIVALDLQGGLEELGYEVVDIASTAAEAVEKCSKLKPDIILMDINLQGVEDGVDAATRIRSLSKASIVFLSAHTDEATLARAKIVGPEGFLLKPFDSEDLRVALQLAIDPERLEAIAREQAEDADSDVDASTPDGIFQAFRSNSIFSSVPDQALRDMLSIMKLRNIRGGEYIHLEHDGFEQGYFLLSGKAAISKISIEGRELLAALVPAGNILSLMFYDRQVSKSLALKAMSDVRYAILPKEVIENLNSKYPEAAAGFRAELLTRIIDTFEVANDLAYLKVEDRIVAMLCRLATLMGKKVKDSENSVRILITRKELAEFCGTSPETAIRCTKSLERSGALDLTRPGVIKILSIDKMRAGLQ